MANDIKDFKKLNQSFMYRIQAPHTPTVLSILLGILLIIVISVLSYVHLDNRKQLERLFGQVKSTQTSLDQLRLSLAAGDLKNAFANLDQAQRTVANLLPKTPEKDTQRPPTSVQAYRPVSSSVLPTPRPAPPPPAQTVQGKTAPTSAAQPVALTITAEDSPFPFLVADEKEHLLLCEKDRQRLHLFQYGGGGFELVKSYPCIVGANGSDKTKEGDFATPIGNYFTLRYIDGRNLPEQYGSGAFVLNYPNFLDRKASKEGTGIWLHGHAPGKRLGNGELLNTRGCISVANDALTEIAGRIKTRGTPVVIANQLKLNKRSQQRQLAQEIRQFMESWGKGWERLQIDPFMSHYSTHFVNADGMTYEAFKRQKQNVNKGKKYIRVQVENLAVLLPQEWSGDVAVVRFLQRYQSDNFRSDTHKLFYLKKEQDRWKIIGESRL